MTDRRWTSVELRPVLGGLAPEDWAACCTEALLPLGCLGTEERGAGDALRIVAWLPDGADAGAVPGLLAAAGLSAAGAVEGSVEDPGWIEQFNASLRPVLVGKRLVILPRPGEAPEGRIAVVIEPGRAFGTGHHESTRLALLHLESCVTPGCSVLDVGTGSGVLALAAVRLGARHATGIDIDPEAVEVALENIATQPEASRLRIVTCSDPFEVEGTFDVVVANITIDILLPMLPALKAKLAPGGRMVLSGLLLQDRKPVDEALAALGFSREWAAEGEWVSPCARLS